MKKVMKIEISGEKIDLNSEKGKEILNHSAAHILAQAVKQLFPKAKLGVGPPTRELPGPEGIGFYYDFKVEKPFDQEDLERIKKKMRELINQNLEFRKEIVSKDEALEKFRDNEFKQELIEDMEGKLSVYFQNGFYDLCKGPHLPNSKYIKAFELLGTSAVYWRGDQNNPTMQRIYGIAFPKEEQLESYLERKEEMEERDHREIGRKQELFTIKGDIGPGLPLYLPKGQVIRKELIKFMREINQELGFREVWTPHLFKSKLWKKSGHYEAYKDKMFTFEVEDQEYALKPMNCPGQIQLYKSKERSYKDLPLRYSEFGTVYRKEQRGELKGLLRAWALTQDDAHSFCRIDQIRSEMKRIVSTAVEIYKTFGMEDYIIYLSTMPEEHIGSEKVWKKATEMIKRALDDIGLDYQINEGEGAFYGPKIDIEVEDALGRYWQCSTIQLDFFMPERFGLEYVGENGKTHKPIMIHRALLGSLERIIGILIEHFAGKFPLWLAPVQVKVLPITDRNEQYAKEITNKMKREGIRVEKDFRDRTLEYKIREAQEQEIPYMIIIGDKEEKENNISVRNRKEEVEKGVELEDFIKSVKKKIENRSLEIGLAK